MCSRQSVCVYILFGATSAGLSSSSGKRCGWPCARHRSQLLGLVRRDWPYAPAHRAVSVTDDCFHSGVWRAPSKRHILLGSTLRSCYYSRSAFLAFWRAYSRGGLLPDVARLRLSPLKEIRRHCPEYLRCMRGTLRLPMCVGASCVWRAERWFNLPKVYYCCAQGLFTVWIRSCEAAVTTSRMIAATLSICGRRSNV